MAQNHKEGEASERRDVSKFTREVAHAGEQYEEQRSKCPWLIEQVQ